MVPEALLEHWFEQLRRHVDLRCLERRGQAHTAVWIDGLGDMASVQEFRLKSAAHMDEVPATSTTISSTSSSSTSSYPPLAHTPCPTPHAPNRWRMSIPSPRTLSSLPPTSGARASTAAGSIRRPPSVPTAAHRPALIL